MEAWVWYALSYLAALFWIVFGVISLMLIILMAAVCILIWLDEVFG